MVKIFKLLSKNLRVKWVGLSVLSVITAYLISLTPLYLGTLLDGFAVGGAEQYLNIFTFSALFLVAEALNIFRRVSVSRVCSRFEEDLRNKSIGKLLKLPLKDLSASGISGELTSKINQAVEGSSQFMKFIPDFLSATFIGIFVVMQCATQAPPIVALVMMSYIVVTLFVSYMQIRSQKGIRENIIRKKTQLDGELVQSVNGLEQIRVLYAEDAENIRLYPKIMGLRLTECYHHTVMGFFDVAKHSIKTVFFVCIFFMGMHLIRKGGMTGGGLVTIVLLLQTLFKPIDEFYRFLDEVSACSVKVSMLDEIMNLPSDSTFQIPEAEYAFNENNIKIGVYEVFSPEGSKILSKGKELCFPTGGCSTAVVARTGGGKSSLLKGIMRLYPLKGSLTLFGEDWNRISQRTLTELIHYVPQTPFFFAGTVRENLAYGLHSSPDDSVLTEALKSACLYDDLLAGGIPPLDIVIQENGKNFSGGQFKRLAIARAFLRTPKLFMLDETLANIDESTAKEILRKLEIHADNIGAGIVHVTHEQLIKNHCSNIINLQSA